MIVGSGSGCGKTTVTCALLKALKNRNVKAISFKCGPDYIDPMFHSKIIDTPSRNLDLFLVGEEPLKYLFSKNSENYVLSVVEGAMGMYDGKGFENDDFSANHISKITGTNEILVVDVKGKSFSLLAEISGYLNLRENRLKGIILNHCSKPMYSYYKSMIEQNLNIKVYGYLPFMKEVVLESRHLGLITADEIENLKDKIQILGATAEETLDIEGIMALAETSEPMSYTEDFIPQGYRDFILGEREAEPVRIALAKDKAFSFYYEDNLSLFRKLGAELVEFSPVNDEKLPENIKGLILGGGYPEEHIEKISNNSPMKNAVKAAVEAGLPTYAECGGFMYLCETITVDGKTYDTVGAIKGNSVMTDKLVRFGYKNLIAQEDNLMCKAGESIKCHEFHHSETDNYGETFMSIKGKQNLPCVNGNANLYAGYPHLHLWGNMDFAINFINKCKNFRR